MKSTRIILVSLVIIALTAGLIGAVTSVFATVNKTINVKQTSLAQQDACSWGVSYWHFVITQVSPASAAPASIHVIWDKPAPNSADVNLDSVTGKTAHYYAYKNGGYKVTDATAEIYSSWDGEFNLSHVVCQDSVCPNGPTAYKWSTLHAPAYKWDPYPIFKSWMQVSFTNYGAATIYNVTATITCKPLNVTVLDGTVNLGNILAGGSAWSSDDFGLAYDMSNPQPVNKMIVWKVEYDDANGNHHTIFNVPKYCGEPIDCP